MSSSELPTAADAGGAAEGHHHSGVGGRIRNYFLTGLIVAGPVAITIWLI